MKLNTIFLILLGMSAPLYAENDQQLRNEIKKLQKQTQLMQSQLNKLQKKLSLKSQERPKLQVIKTRINNQRKTMQTSQHAASKRTTKFSSTNLSIHTPLQENPDSVGFYPTALVAGQQVVTYIAGTPVISAPYLGSRPAFDGSDYIVNISSINRDIRLMQQRRQLYRAYESIGYPVPPMPIIALSGKSEPVGMIGNSFRSPTNADLTLGSSELAVAAGLNQNVEAYIALAYDADPPEVGPRIDNSAFNLNMGFINIGNLDKTPFYFTAGQLFVPFGRYSSSMISAPLTMSLARTKTRPFIFGYKSQDAAGPFAATYVYRSDTTLGRSGVEGVNLGYIFQYGHNDSGELGVSYISSINDAAGMQSTGAPQGTFGGFGSLLNGNENVRKTPALGFHANFGYDRFNFAAEWVGTTESFRVQDLSFNGEGAKPQAIQTEIDMTFRAFNRPSSAGVAYQWSKEALALNLPENRISGVFNISIWKDTVESIEYRHDWDYKCGDFANGAAPVGLVNAPSFGTGGTADTVSIQIGVYF